MNREQRRLMEREERRNKAGQEGTSRREQAMARAAAPATERVGFFRRIVTFLHDVRLEMKKVSWPTQQQMIAYTSVTVITSAALTLFIFGLDVALKQVVLFFVGGF